MNEKEMIEMFKQRYLNSKTNNYIFSRIDDYKILDKIPNRCSILIPENDIDINFAENIKIDLDDVNIKDILSFTLELLKKSKFIDISFDYTIDFNNKFDLLKFQNVLRTYNRIVQLIFYKVEKLSHEDQMLFNEICYFNSIFFNANSFIKGDNFQSYFLSKDRVLDNRENYTKIKLIRNL